MGITMNKGKSHKLCWGCATSDKKRRKELRDLFRRLNY